MKEKAIHILSENIEEDSYTLVGISSVQKPRRASDPFESPRKDVTEGTFHPTTDITLTPFLMSPKPIPHSNSYDSLVSHPLSNFPPPLLSTPNPRKGKEGINQDDFSSQILSAAIETAKSYQISGEEYGRRLLMKNFCTQKLTEKSEKNMRNLLRMDPFLAVFRFVGMPGIAADGQTPLHVAASHGRMEALKVLLEMGRSIGASSWIRDIQGRTPLHCAAETGQVDMCEYLRETMRSERGIDPVGTDAPTDLAGTTPLGSAKTKSRNKPTAAIEKALFQPGDWSVLPRTPYSLRTGKSPAWKHLSRSTTKKTTTFDLLLPSALPPSSNDSMIFAFSEAQGWQPYMEDRLSVACPLSRAYDQFSMFGVFDGHGGDLCSSHLSKHLATILTNELDRISSGNEDIQLQLNPEMLECIWKTVCARAEKELAELPQLEVESNKSGTVFNCFDSSGSTAIIALTTPLYLAVANIGDSRCVLAQRHTCAESSVSRRTSVSSPFALSASHSNSKSTLGSKLDHSESIDELSNSLDVMRIDNLQTLERKPSTNNSCTTESKSDRTAERTSPSIWKTTPLSVDHKLSTQSEMDRAIAAKATVELIEGSDCSYRISVPAFDGKLSMSRSFGDFFLKQNKQLSVEEQAIIAVPDVIVHTRHKDDAFMVVACDGIWDVMTNEEVVDFIGEKLGYTRYGDPVGGIRTQSVADACDMLLQECVVRGAEDNLTVIVVVFGVMSEYLKTCYSLAQVTPMLPQTLPRKVRSRSCTAASNGSITGRNRDAELLQYTSTSYLSGVDEITGSIGMEGTVSEKDPQKNLTFMFEASAAVSEEIVSSQIRDYADLSVIVPIVDNEGSKPTAISGLFNRIAHIDDGIDSPLHKAKGANLKPFR